MRATLVAAVREAIQDAYAAMQNADVALQEFTQFGDGTIFFPLAEDALKVASLAVRRASLLYSLAQRPAAAVERV